MTVPQPDFWKGIGLLRKWPADEVSVLGRLRPVTGCCQLPGKVGVTFEVSVKNAMIQWIVVDADTGGANSR